MASLAGLLPVPRDAFVLGERKWNYRKRRSIHEASIPRETLIAPLSRSAAVCRCIAPVFAAPLS